MLFSLSRCEKTQHYRGMKKNSLSSTEKMPPKVERLKTKKKILSHFFTQFFFMLIFENGSSVCKHSIRRMLASTPMSNIRRRIYENVVLKRWQNQITWISFNAIINWCEYCKSGSKQKKINKWQRRIAFEGKRTKCLLIILLNFNSVPWQNHFGCISWATILPFDGHTNTKKKFHYYKRFCLTSTISISV